MAYFTEKLILNEPIYRPLTEPITNNYPPLFFYITDWCSDTFHDLIITGRILSLIGLLLTAVMMSLIIYKHINSLFLCLLGPVLFTGYMTIYHGEYVAMNDPQWLAIGMMLVGFTVFLYKRDNLFFLLFSLIIMLIAGLIKHNIISIPAAITVWLLFYNKKLFFKWIYFSVILLMIALICLYSLYGMDFFNNLLRMPRTYRIGLLFRYGLWLGPMLLYLLLTVFFFIGDKSINTRLLLIAVVISFIWGLLLSGGGGVAYNVVFEFIIFIFISAFIGIKSINSYLNNKTCLNYSFHYILILFLSFPVLFKAPFEIYLAKEYIKSLSQVESEYADDIAFLKTFKNPVICEDLSLAYWAGKSSLFDFYGTGQKIKTDTITFSDITKQLDKKEFSIIQFNSLKSAAGHLTENIIPYIIKNYEPVRQSNAAGMFYIPKKK